MLHWKADGVLRAREIRRLEPQRQIGQRSRKRCDWSAVEIDRPVHGPQVGEDPIPIAPLLFAGARVQEGKNHNAGHG